MVFFFSRRFVIIKIDPNLWGHERSGSGADAKDATECKGARRRALRLSASTGVLCVPWDGIFDIIHIAVLSARHFYHADGVTGGHLIDKNSVR